MELKSGFKKTEVGIIPIDWDTIELGAVSRIEGGFAFKSSKFLSDGIYQVVKMSNVYNGILDLKRSRSFLNEIEKIEEYFILKENDILITLTGTVGKKDYGYTYIVKRHKNLLLNQRVGRIVTKDYANSEYVFYQVRMPSFTNQFFESSKGGTGNQTNVSTKNIASIIIPMPSKVEQEAIATALSDTEKLVTSIEKLIDKKRNMKHAAMQKLLQPKEGWEEKTYGEVFEFLTTATYSRAQLTENDEVRYVHYGDIHTKWNCFLDIPKSRLPTLTSQQVFNYNLVMEGDLIMADASEDYAGIGKSVEVKNLGNVKAIAGLHTFLMRDMKGVFINGFKGYIHLSTFIKAQFDRLATGLKVYGVSKTNLKTVKIPVPPKEEQTLIANILSDMDAEIAALETKLEKYRKIKLGMMQNLLTGKIRLI